MSLRTFQDALGETTLDADVVIVGSGPGGAASAKVLAEAGARVVLLEEGPATPRFRPNQAHTARYHLQEDGMMVARGSALVPIAAGRGVGGGTLVNSAICFRTPDAVLASWREVLGGDDRFDPVHMGPVFDEIEELLAGLRHVRAAMKAKPDSVVTEIVAVDELQHPDNAKLREKLAAEVGMHGFEETPLQDVVNALKERCKVEIQIDRKALEEVGIGLDSAPTTFQFGRRFGRNEESRQAAPGESCGAYQAAR